MNNDKENIVNSLLIYKQKNKKESFTIDTFINFIRKENDPCNSNNHNGHITTSGWVLNKEFRKVLLVRKEDSGLWLQPGGHVESYDKCLEESAAREVMEETGVSQVKLLQDFIFDISCHIIPAKKGFPSHFHYDIRFLFVATEPRMKTKKQIGFERISWFNLEEACTLNAGEGIVRMVLKTQETSFN